MIETCVGIFLGGCAISDAKSKKIHVTWLVLWAVIGGIWQPLEGFGGVFAGLFLLLAAFASHGEIGAGDGLAFLVTGFFLTFWDNMLLLLLSLLLVAGHFLVELLLAHVSPLQKKLESKPLLPYVFFVFLGINLWGQVFGEVLR